MKMQMPYGHMVHEYYAKRVRTLMDERSRRLKALKTRRDAEAYVKRVRRVVRNALGPFPARTPLKPRITGREFFDKFTIEKVIFQSRPRFFVTGNLYLPLDLSKPQPCVLGLCGHSKLGKAGDAYQSFCQGLASKGFVVFIIDPIQQGERNQLPAEARDEYSSLCGMHNMMGNAMAPTGDFFGAWRLWDAIRGLDYLLTRPEVDTKRVGVTGNSGGGTLTSYVAAVDPRPTMVAASCYISSYLGDTLNELPADSEQNPPGMLGAGLDQADLLLAYAPRPTMILSQHNDFFDERYAYESGRELSRVHKLLGSRGSAGYFAGPGNHGYSVENREEMYRFFMRHAGVSGEYHEDDIDLLEPQRLYATPEGQTFEFGSKNVFSFTAKRARELSRQRRRLSADALRKSARHYLHLPARNTVPSYSSLHMGYPWLKLPVKVRGIFSLEPEDGIKVPVVTMGREHPSMHPPTGPVSVYVGNTGSLQDVVSLKWVADLAENGTLAVVDVRGMGLTMAMTCGSANFFDLYGSDFHYACLGELLGESYLGRRVGDLLSALYWLKANGAKPEQLVGRGLGAVITAFAALLYEDRPDVSLVNYLPSYRMLAEETPSHWPLSSMLRGCLAKFDLPDVYRALGKRLTLKDPWDAKMQPGDGR